MLRHRVAACHPDELQAQSVRVFEGKQLFAERLTPLGRHPMAL